MTRKLGAVAIIGSILASGCAGTTTFQSYPGLDPSKETATVHVVRDSGVVASAITAPVYVDRFLIGRIGPGGIVSTPVPVGPVFVTSSAADAIVETERGAEYFFEITGPTGPWITTPTFEISRIQPGTGD